MNRFLPLFCAILLASPFVARGEEQIVLPEAPKIEEKRVVADVPTQTPSDTLAVAVKEVTPSDTTRITLSERRKRRGISDLRTEFVPKGQWVFGGSISYSTHSNNNYTFLIVEDIQSDGYTFKVSPLVGYAYAKNSLVGVRFGYSRSRTQLDNASLSITSLDNSFYYSLKHSYNAEALWRKYIPLGRNNKRFALFAEVSLAMGGSQSKLAAGPQNALSGTYATSFDVALGVNPGIAAFLTNNFAIEVNVGVFGFNYSQTRQVSNQVVSGQTSTSQMNFKVNIFSIGLGAAFYL